MTKAITIIDILKKLDAVYNISSSTTSSVLLTLPTFKKIMMLYPDLGPVISSERVCREKYRTLKEFGILNETGRVDIDAFTRWATA